MRTWNRGVWTVLVATVVLITGAATGACSDDGSSGPDVVRDNGEFTHRAARICGDVLKRRAGDADYRKDRDAIVTALVTVIKKQRPPAEVAQALTRTIEEYERTTRDLGRITSADPKWAEAWSQVAAAITGDAKTYRDRRDALVSEDSARLAAQFRPGGLTSDINAPLTVLGLNERDCRLLLQ
ncbi:hypothetical protein ACIRL2_38260 [Embleya sp. NPDC127516]|uniref:hypothetical protein n=1 Tax=Embleya sp. NPDC127516 TaxID=3363990 RepID=UPI0038102386